ncbi:MAG: nitroreductase [Prevotellaceae bacterium]|jgi:nitroreductase|nr:nitroreductase [Prevotellaceae bacterium]
MKLKNFLALFLAILMLSCGQQANNENREDKKVAEKQAASAIDVIMSRRSIRSYKPEQIKDEELNTILECGINAPSAMNNQSWEIRVIQNPELLKQIKGSYHDAPTLIVVASAVDNFFSPVDCGLLGQNILLAAESLDIGTCVLGNFTEFLNSPEGADVVQRLELSEGYRPLYAISAGYKNEKPEAKPRDKGKIKIIK